MSQECRFWHRTSPEVAHKVKKGQEHSIHLKNQPGLQNLFPRCSLIWLLARDPFLSVNLSTGSLCVLTGRERGKRVQTPLWPHLRSHTVSLLHTLCNSSKLLGLATLKKRRIKLHFLMEGVSNSLWRWFKTSQVEPVPQMMQVLILGPDFEQKVLKNHQ